MNIFQIVEELEQVYAELEENGGELTPELESALAITETDLEDKMNAYALYIDTLNNKIAFLESKIGEFKEKIDTTKKQVDKIKSDVLLPVVKKYGETTKSGGYRYKTPMKTFYTAKTQKVEVEEDYFDDQRFIKYDVVLKDTFKEIKDNVEQFMKGYIEKYPNIQIIDNKKINKKDLKEALKSGEKIEFANIVENIGLRLR
jgi:SMC interacting uncharacterized protein involved in chromosome segregation